MEAPKYDDILKAKIAHYGNVEAARAFAAAEYAEQRVKHDRVFRPKPVLLFRASITRREAEQFSEHMQTVLSDWHILVSAIDGRTPTIQVASAEKLLPSEKEEYDSIIERYGEWQKNKK